MASRGAAGPPPEREKGLDESAEQSDCVDLTGTLGRMSESLMLTRNRPQLLGFSRAVPAPAAARRQASADLQWESAVELFVQCWAADHPGIRPLSLRYYRKQLGSRLAAFALGQGVTRVQDFSRSDLRAFVAWLEAYVSCYQRPLTQRGKQMALNAAKTFFKWLHQEQIVSEDIGAQVRTYRLDKNTEPRATPTADLEKLLDVLSSRPTGIRDRAMVYLMAFCGLRVSELVGLNMADLDLVSGRVRVRAETSKGRRTRSVDLPLMIRDGQEMVKPEVTRVLSSWLALRAQTEQPLDDDAPLFVGLDPRTRNHTSRGTSTLTTATRSARERISVHTVRSILRRAAQKAGVAPRRVMPHRLRHYFGLASAKAGVPTTALMRAMGHRSPTMTARYSEFADSERRWAFARADIAKGIRLAGPE